jgi:hypothetical protein
VGYESLGIIKAISMQPRRGQEGARQGTYVLIAIVKRELQLDASLYTCLQILSVSTFEKTEISRALRPDRTLTEMPIDANQLILFDV